MRRPWNTISQWKWLWTAITLVLVALWVASGWFQLGYGRRDGYFACVTDGRFCIGYHTPSQLTFFGFYKIDKKWWSVNLGFEHRSNLPGNPNYWDTLVPIWVLWLPTAALTIIASRQDTAHRRALQLHRCTNCDYSRLGLPPDAPCPECGHHAPKPS